MRRPNAISHSLGSLADDDASPVPPPPRDQSPPPPPPSAVTHTAGRITNTDQTTHDVRSPRHATLSPASAPVRRWLGSRVVSVLQLDSGAEGPGSNRAVTTLSGNSLRQTVHTHRASVHQAAKLVAAVLRVAWVTAGLAKSNGSLTPGL